MGMPTTDDDKTKKREATEKNEEDNGKKPKVDDGEEEKPAKEEEKPMFLKGLVDKDGSPVDEASLQGKVVALYFSSSWCKYI